MELTREEALKLHRQMWSDMQKELGDCPTREERIEFKHYWCLDHTPESLPKSWCYLCEYTKQIIPYDCANSCPIDWGGRDCMYGKVDYRYSPISKILALPERKENIGTN